MPSPRQEWAKVIAFAWTHSETLTELRKDPKRTIEELATGKNGRYHNVVDDDTETAAKSIILRINDNPQEDYVGYLPLPKPPEGLADLDTQVLKNLIAAGGLAGILQCDRSPEEWAEVMKFAWSSNDNFVNIRKDPLKFLPEKTKDKLLQTDYGILPLPALPRGLNDLKVGQLISFLTDKDNVSNLGGVFLLGS